MASIKSWANLGDAAKFILKLQTYKWVPIARFTKNLKSAIRHWNETLEVDG